MTKNCNATFLYKNEKKKDDNPKTILTHDICRGIGLRNSLSKHIMGLGPKSRTRG